MLAADFEEILKENKRKNDVSMAKIKDSNKRFSRKIKEILAAL
jgi:hypothetical protein